MGLLLLPPLVIGPILVHRCRTIDARATYTKLREGQQCCGKRPAFARQGAVLLDDEEWTISSGGWIVADHVTNESFELSFDITPMAVERSDWSMIIRFSHPKITSSTGTGHGGLPALLFWPNSTRLRASMATEGATESCNSVDMSSELALNKRARVNLRLWGSTLTLLTEHEVAGFPRSDQAQITVSSKPAGLGRVSVWAADDRSGHLPANAEISNLIYKPLEQCLFATMCSREDVNGIYYQVGSCWLGPKGAGEKAPLYRHMEEDMWICRAVGPTEEPRWQLRVGDPRGNETFDSGFSEGLLYYRTDHPHLNCPVGLEHGHWIPAHSEDGRGPLVVEQSRSIAVHGAGPLRFPSLAARNVNGHYVPVGAFSFSPRRRKAPAADLYKHLTLDIWISFGALESDSAECWAIRLSDPRTLGSWSPEAAGKGVLYASPGELGPSVLPKLGWFTWPRSGRGRESPPILRPLNASSGWRSNRELEGYWDVHYLPGFAPSTSVVLQIRVDGMLLVSAYCDSATRGAALLAPHHDSSSEEPGWLDEAEGFVGRGVREKLKVRAGTLYIKRWDEHQNLWSDAAKPAQKVVSVTHVIRGTWRCEAGSCLWRNLRTAQNFEVSFDLLAFQRNDSEEMLHVLSFVDSAVDPGKPGECLPSFYIMPRSLRLGVRIDAHDERGTVQVASTSLLRGASSRISARLQGDEFRLRIDGEEVRRIGGFAGQKLQPITTCSVWASDNNHVSAMALITGLIYVALPPDAQA